MSLSSEIPELNPLALSEILAKHTKDLTDDEVTILIRALRKEREEFILAEASNKKKVKSELTKAAEKVDLINLKFDDLGI